MPTVPMPLEKYWKIAMEIWGMSHSRGSAKKECVNCTNEFKKEGKEVPVFPPDYKGDCPRCGGEFRNTLPG